MKEESEYEREQRLIKHRQVCKRNYQNNKEQKLVYMMKQRILKGQEVKQSTLQKYAKHF